VGRKPPLLAGGGSAGKKKEKIRNIEEKAKKDFFKN
jgi:hypothetical protein